MRHIALACTLVALWGCRSAGTATAPAQPAQIRAQREPDLVLTPRRPTREEVAQESLLFELGSPR